MEYNELVVEGKQFTTFITSPLPAIRDSLKAVFFIFLSRICVDTVFALFRFLFPYTFCRTSKVDFIIMLGQGGRKEESAVADLTRPRRSQVLVIHFLE